MYGIRTLFHGDGFVDTGLRNKRKGIFAFQKYCRQTVLNRI